MAIVVVGGMVSGIAARGGLVVEEEGGPQVATGRWGGSLLSPESSLTKICMVSSGSEEERAEVEEVGLEGRMVSVVCVVASREVVAMAEGRRG